MLHCGEATFGAVTKWLNDLLSKVQLQDDQLLLVLLLANKVNRSTPRRDGRFLLHFSWRLVRLRRKQN